FGEAQGRVVVSVADNQLANFLRHLEKCEITHKELGTVTDGGISINNNNWGSITEWKELYNTAIEKRITSH
ncbi:MAG: hypothetical protein WCP65_06910, partial [Bacteroidota bacterium]